MLDMGFEPEVRAILSQTASGLSPLLSSFQGMCMCMSTFASHVFFSFHPFLSGWTYPQSLLHVPSCSIVFNTLFSTLVLIS
jgi:hypothetical protein